MDVQNCGVPLSASESMRLFLKLIQAGEDCPLTGSGNSMRPFLKSEKDILMMTPAKGKEIRRGDIILYIRTDGRMVIHRVYKVCSDGTIWFVGDNQFSVERDITKSQLIAKAKEVIKEGKVYDCEKGFTRQKYIAYMIIRVKLYGVLHRGKGLLKHLMRRTVAKPDTDANEHSS